MWLVSSLLDSVEVSIVTGSSMGWHWSSKWRVGGAPGWLSLPWDRPSSDHGDKFQACKQALILMARAGEGVCHQEEDRGHVTVKGAPGAEDGQ